jgi:uncharacterized repeat protein (TIGR01451 family)
MKKTRLLMLVGVLLLSLALVGMALAADNAQKPNPDKGTGMTSSAPRGGQTDSLSGSLVTFDPSVGGDETYIPGLSQTFCFRAESFTSDWGYVYDLWMKFPTDWTINNAYVSGTPSCTGGGTFGTFSWSFVTSPYEVDLYHPRYQTTVDNCLAYYCFDVVTGTGAPDALESWFWNGDGYGAPPYNPCSSDGYTPPGQPTCDEAINLPAIIPPGVLDPVMLTPLAQDTSGCGGTAHDYIETVWNNTGYDTTIDLFYTITSGAGICTGPDFVDLVNGTTTDITVNLVPIANPGETVECQVYAVDEFDPVNNATAVLSYNVISGGVDPAGWMLETNVGALGAQWQACAVGTNPAAAGDVGYQIAGLDTVGGTQFNLQMYDPAAATWTQLAAAPHNWFGQVAGWIDGKLYVAGGSDATFTGNTDLTVYDPATNTWDNTSYADLPVARLGAYGGAAPCYTYGVGDCLYVMGGTPTGTFTDFSFSAYEYDPLANVWTQLTNIPGNPANYGTALGGGVACNGQVFVGGDYRGIADFFKFDTATGTWSQVAGIPASAGKMTPAMVCNPLENAIYLIGGDSLGSWGDTANNKIFRYDIGSDTWEGPLPQTLNTGLLGSCGLFLADKLWTFGGTNGSYAITPAPHESLAFISCGPTGPLQAEKTATPFILPGDVIDYSIAIANTSDVDVATTMVDPIPAGTTYVLDSVACDSGTCSYDPGSNSILWEGEVGPAVGKSIENIGNSGVNFIDPTSFPPSGTTADLCFNVHVESPDAEYMDGFDFDLPDDWTVNSVTDVEATGCANGHTYGVGAGNLVYWYTNGMPTGCGDWNYGDYDFCANVTVPAGCTLGWDLPWNYYGDTWGGEPHSTSGTALASCVEEPNLNPVTITFQVTADDVTCPSLVTNVATISSEGNPDVIATADTNIYCSLDPDIVVTPLALVADQAPDEVTTQQLQICNEGPTPLDWSLTEVPGLKVDRVSPAISTKQPFAINKPANVSHDPSIDFTPTKPNSEILLDQAPNLETGIFIDASCDICAGPQVLADNFALEATASLEQIVFWTGYYPTDTPIDPDHIRILIHQDAAGLPGAVVYDESDVAYTRVQTGVILFGVHEWMHTLTLNTPASLPAGSYWLEIFNDTGFGTDDFFWETGDLDTMGRGLFDAAWALEAPGVNWIFPNGYEQALQLIGTIAQADIPWLSETPTSGTVDGFACVFVDVSFDSTAMVPGTYTGVLDVNSNDPDEPVVPVDVTMTVLEVADIDVTPTSLSSSQSPDEQVVKALNIGNTGNGELVWNIFEFNAPLSLANPVSPLQSSGANGNSLSQEKSFRVATPSVILKNSDSNLLALINDGSFENGPPPGSAWTEVTDQPCEWIGDWSGVWGVPAFDGFYDYWAGGYCGGIPTTSHVSQDNIAIPAGSATLSFWYNSYRPDADDGGDYAYIKVNGTTEWTLDLIQANNTYPNFVNATVDLSAYAGQNVILEFGAVSGGVSTGNIRFDFIEWLVSETCASPSDIPWLSEAPTDGVTPGGGSTPIAVTFDSTGLTAGDYAANLCVASNDLDEPLVIVPVDMTVVAPDIVVTPTSLELTLFAGETGTLPFTIENIGDAILTWSATDGATWLSVAPASGTIDPAGSTEVVATFDSAGLLPGVYETDIDIASDDLDTPHVLLPVTLTVNALESDLSVIKTANADTVRVGDMITYTLVVSNAGDDDAIGVMLVDTLSDLVIFSDASEGCVEDAGVVTCDIGNLAADASITLTIVVTADVEGIAENTAVVSSDFVTDPVPANNTYTVDTEIMPVSFYFYLPIIQKG